MKFKYCRKSHAKTCEFSSQKVIFFLLNPPYQVAHPCDICGKQIRQLQWLLHYKKEHNISSDDGSRYSCHQCGKVFMRRQQRARHIHEDHLKISYDCDKCGKSFKNTSSINQHMQKVHMKEDQGPNSIEIILA